MHTYVTHGTHESPVLQLILAHQLRHFQHVARDVRRCGEPSDTPFAANALLAQLRAHLRSGMYDAERLVACIDELVSFLSSPDGPLRGRFETRCLRSCPANPAGVEAQDVERGSNDTRYVGAGPFNETETGTAGPSRVQEYRAAVVVKISGRNHSDGNRRGRTVGRIIVEGE